MTVIVADSYSLCYGEMDVGGGAMVLGGVSPPNDMSFCPFKRDLQVCFNLSLPALRITGLVANTGVYMDDNQFLNF